jgi:hypothetical protein
MALIGTPEKDSLLATALAAGANAPDAAEQLGLSLRTVRRRLEDPDFRRLVAELRAEMVASALGFMTDNLTRAARSVAGLLEAPEPHIRLRAARTMLSLTLRMREAVDLDTRLSELEAELARKQGIQQ